MDICISLIYGRLHDGRKFFSFSSKIYMTISHYIYIYFIPFNSLLPLLPVYNNVMYGKSLKTNCSNAESLITMESIRNN